MRKEFVIVGGIKLGQADRISQIKAVYNFRKSILKHRRIGKALICSLLIVSAGAFYVLVYAKDTVKVYNEKTEGLVVGIQNLKNEKSYIENQKEEIEKKQEEIKSEQERLYTEAEQLAKNNQSLIEENMRLQDSLKLAASVGIEPQNFGTADKADTAVDYEKLEYVGEFEGTAYTPSPDECSNNLGYTASGKPIVAGVSIAVDTKYWKLGTEFYIEGLGYVVAMDTGNAVKGKYRFDYAVFDKSFAYKLGRRNWKVYLVKDGE